MQQYRFLWEYGWQYQISHLARKEPASRKLLPAAGSLRLLI
jgi:hypothetical protein